MMYPFIKIIDVILELFSYAVITQIIVSWLIVFNVLNTQQPLVRSILDFLYRITEPLYRKIRRYMPDLGGIDLTPLVVLLGIYFMRMLLWRTVAPLLGV